MLDSALSNVDVKLHITLDGPKHVHDTTRFLANGKGTYDVIMNNLVHLHNMS